MVVPRQTVGGMGFPHWCSSPESVSTLVLACPAGGLHGRHIASRVPLRGRDGPGSGSASDDKRGKIGEEGEEEKKKKKKKV